IGLGATLGGVGGGLIAQATAAWLPAQAILLVVAALQVACVVLLRALSRRRVAAGAHADEPGDVWQGMRVVAHTPLLRHMAGIALLVAISAAALDYAFKAEIAGSARGPLGALAIYYTIVDVATSLTQLLATDRVIARIGVARGAAVLPAVLAG